MVYIPPLTPWAFARQKAAKQLFSKSMAHARAEAFYSEGGVPDTFDGRFEVIAMLAALLVNRLQREGRAGAKLGQSLFDVMFLDLELACRESGIGDLSIPRHMKRMMAGFNGRLLAYAETDLTDAVRRNLFGTIDDVPMPVVNTMANYIARAREDLDKLSYDDILNSKFEWIDFKGMTDNEIRKTA